MRAIASLVPLLLAPALAAEVPANVVDLHLNDGTRVTGPLLQETPTSYVVHQVVLTKKGMMASDRTFAKAEVAQCVPVQAEYERRDHAASDDAAAQADLAAWCLDEQLRDEADEHAHRALKKDAANAQAATVLAALDYVDDHGTWMKADDYLAAHGLALLDGKVMTIAERDSIAKLATQRQADQADADAAQAAADAAKRAVAHDQDRIDAIGKEQASIDQRLAQDKQAEDAVATSKKALDAADAEVRKEEKKKTKKGGGATSASLAAQHKAKDDYQAAEDAASQAKIDQDAATERQKALASDLAAAKSDLDAQKAKLPTATQDASDAAAKARDSDQRYQAAFAAIVPPTDLPPQLTAVPTAGR